VLALLTAPESWLTLVTLSALEIVLGVDNVIFLAVLVGRLPPARRPAARFVGLALAMVTRIALLFSIVWLTRLTAAWFHVFGLPVSGRGLILGAGGLFLVVQSVREIRTTLAGAHEPAHGRPPAGFTLVVLEVALLDVVFSLDSVFTAVGLARPEQLPIMVAAIVVAIIVMMGLSGPIAAFVDRYAAVKVLALAFLVLIGVSLMAQAAQWEIPKGYLYFAMGFALAVELLNLRLRHRS
jgi:predicted tellurium resistance membrane protein TerC